MLTSILPSSPRTRHRLSMAVASAWAKVASCGLCQKYVVQPVIGGMGFDFGLNYSIRLSKRELMPKPGKCKARVQKNRPLRTLLYTTKLLTWA